MQPHDPTIHLLLGRIHIAQGHASAAAESCGARCGSIPTSRGASPAGLCARAMGRFASGRQLGRLGAPRARPEEEAQRADVQRAREAAGCSAMADEIRALSAQLAQDPQSLVFLRSAKRAPQGQLEAAMRVATNGSNGIRISPSPRPVRAHPDRQARLRTRLRRMGHAVRIARPYGRSGLAFLYFKVGDLAQAEHISSRRARSSPMTRASIGHRDDAQGLGPPSPHRVLSRAGSDRRSSTAAVSSGAFDEAACSPDWKERTKGCCSSTALDGCSVER